MLTDSNEASMIEPVHSGVNAEKIHNLFLAVHPEQLVGLLLVERTLTNLSIGSIQHLNSS